MKKKLINVIPLFAVATLFAATPSLVLAYQAAPVAISKSALFVTEKSAKLNGQANPSEMPDAYGWFEWGISGRPGVVYETPHQTVGSWYGNTLVETSADIVGLAPSTQYFYRQVAENGRGKDIGQTVYFTTKALVIEVPPIVIVETETPSASNETDATLRGYVSPHGNNSTKAWFEWGTTQRLEGQTAPTAVSLNANFFVSTITKLTPGTTYFYRIVAENSAGRAYGAVRMFNTSGTPPPPPEKEVAQAIPVVTNGGDGISRTTSSDGVHLATSQGKSGSGSNTQSNSNSSFAAATLPGLPADFFTSLFRKKAAPVAVETNTANTNIAVNSDHATDPNEQVASVAQAGGPLSTFWNALVGGKDDTSVTVEKVGPTDIPVHSPVEYRITYHYGESVVATGARLKIVIPFEIIYIGDNTNNELLLEEGSGGERTYVLPIGRIERGGTRTLSVLGMTTSGAKGFPDARVRLEYQSAGATHVVSSGGAAAAAAASKGKSAAKSQTASSGNGILPSSALGWILYLVLTVLAIVGIRKGKEFYQQKKESIDAEEKEDDRTRLARIIPSAVDVSLQA